MLDQGHLSDLTVTESPLSRPCFHIQSHSEVQQARILPWEYVGGKSQSTKLGLQESVERETSRNRVKFPVAHVAPSTRPAENSASHQCLLSPGALGRSPLRTLPLGVGLEP